jgi:hypothetical protein
MELRWGMDETSRKVAAKYLARQLPDFWLDRSQVGALCPPCAQKMASLNIRQVRASVFYGDELECTPKTADKWKTLPKGWTLKSLKKFWEGLTGGKKHKVTACIKHVTGKIDDPGAFCASAMDRLEGTGWRSKR